MTKPILIALIAITSLFFQAVAQPNVAYAACGGNNSAKGQVLTGAGETGNDCNDKAVNNLIQTIVKILSFIIGVVAVIMIMVGGFKYITSNGDTNGVANAKSTLIYALVGLAIAILAQFLVGFVLSTVKT
jgi:hypothetical protein